jgi:peptidyl-prolyl cis-trans isomerase B (cyclophilin B)
VLAWVTLGLGAGAVLFGALTSLAAIITGHIALSQIRTKGELGAPAALTGLILGYVFTALNLFALIVIVMLFISIGAIATSPDIW